MRGRFSLRSAADQNPSKGFAIFFEENCQDALVFA
jgi:hypothetical protein